MPATSGTSAWPPSLPSVPTSRATRVTCSAKSRSVSVSELIVSASSATSPVADDGDLLRQVALGHRGRHLGDRAHLAGQVGRHRVHRVGEVLPGAGDAAHVGLAAELALGADLAGHPGDLVGERRQLVHHRVHGAADRAGTRRAAGGPSISSAMCWDRSPSATATITRAISVVGPAQVVDQRVDRALRRRPRRRRRPSSSRRSVSRPSRPTTRLIRRSVAGCCRSCSATTSLNASATSPASAGAARAAAP